jgi:hypothetical protein
VTQSYKNRPPMDPATELRRYTSLNAIEHMLRDKQLRLTRLDRFQDPFEGSVPKQQIDDQLPIFSSATQMDQDPSNMPRRHSEHVSDPWTRMTQRRRAGTRSAHASCWTAGQESEAMWRLYCEDGERGQGVALQSTLSKLEASIEPHDVFVSPISYRLYHVGPAFNDELDPFMHKRLGFECEREVRLLSCDLNYWRALAWATIGGDGYGPAPVMPSELDEHIFLDNWRPLDIADAIVISPYATGDYERRVRDGISAIDSAAASLVELSVLSEHRYAPNF